MQYNDSNRYMRMNKIKIIENINIINYKYDQLNKSSTHILVHLIGSCSDAGLGRIHYLSSTHTTSKLYINEPLANNVTKWIKDYTNNNFN